MSETKPFTVKITAGQPGSWYSKHIGCKVIVYEYDGFLYLLDDFNPYAIGLGRYVRKEDCEVVPIPNPGDMLSRPVDADKLDRLDKEVDQLLESETDETLRAWADSQPVRSAPSKEGASQSPGEIPEDIKQWIEIKADERTAQFKTRAGVDEVSSYAYLYGCRDLATDMYLHMIQGREIDKQKNQTLQSHLSSMTERKDAALALLAEAKRNFEKLTAALSEMTLQKEKWEKECSTLADLLEGKNLENAVMRDALHCAINIVDLWGASQHGTVSADHEGEMHALLEMESKIREGLDGHRNKYKKEEQK